MQVVARSRPPPDTPLPPPPSVTGSMADPRDQSQPAKWHIITASTSKQRATIPSLARESRTRTCHSLKPATSHAFLHILASPTCSYKSTQTQQAACLNVGMKRYPNLYRISGFDIRMNEKFDINITSSDMGLGT